MPYCAKCGADNQPDASFCTSCGTKISSEAPQAGTQTVHQFETSGSISQEDYSAFVVKNTEYYLRQFSRFTSAGVENFTVSWNWPCFLFGFWWMLYRKLYLWALGAFIATFIPYVNFIAWIAFGLSANYIYYKFAREKITEARRINPGITSSGLGELGGVNAWVRTVAIVVTLAALIGVVLVGVFLYKLGT